MLIKVARVDAGVIIPAIPMLDPPLHRPYRPYCKDSTCPCQGDRRPRHTFTKEEARRGGQHRQQLPGAHRHQQAAYEALKWRRPDMALLIYRERILPRYRRDGSPED
jgi:hypothetical protein